ncbi:SIN component Cdc14 [Schizosaccharomyces pombe]|uniref:Cell division control protein 14 n=1 Tax=Schizosaccharomyces pombe (strain 972 / ATCC 24843) TaxID=284812 RepID=CDC14_SCHPO|nr:SIN component Cdc14 [Schizosaccharomyces pombe]P36589.1 RecName: Full=Cell division control protein 14 [Schizosaccharomyces pombe 972h-]CAA21151.1 SIN component Cdc14 [Schizosaccharomyces pombe]CAA51416.1 cdc14 [Schizosaccharomyces pombe]|eukprot:NP_595961.1 SIN component Cdc14 [Schizosaccharomyces pombe]
MEDLLNNAKQHLCMRNPKLIRIGLRQVESIVYHVAKPSHDDKIPREIFLKLQDSPLYNSTTPCIYALDSLLEYQQNEEAYEKNFQFIQKLIDDLLHVIEGLVLIHPKSQTLFEDKATLRLFIHLLQPSQPSMLQVAAMKTLVCIMADRPLAIRLFEQINGLQQICVVFKHKQTSQDTRFQILEFFYFYLSPEPYSIDVIAYRKTRTEKQAYLSKYLSNVQGLRDDLDKFQPFGKLDETFD